MILYEKTIKYHINDSNCWICDNYKPFSEFGYYRIRVNGKKELLHRVVYENYKNKIGEGLIVRHKCDNPYCINPEHLEEGSYYDNFNDMIERKRNKIAIKGKCCKPTEKIYVIDYDYTYKVYENARDTGYDNSKILKLCKSKKYFGYNKMFMYEDDFNKININTFIKGLKVKGIKLRNKKYESSIIIDKKYYYLGSFDNILDANISRLSKEYEIFGLDSPQVMFFKAYNII
jgi:hypothetical protein